MRRDAMPRTAAANKPAVNLQFSHMGLSVRNLEEMEKFYTEVLGFTVTDAR
jgi:catechol-2,3-dioxygenase